MEVNVAIVGAGIIGLSTARILIDQGYRVHIYTKDPLEKITSMKAAAIWFPFKAHPRHKILAWSRKSLDYYRIFSEDPASGVTWVEFWVLDTPQQAQSWLDAVPGSAVKVIPTNALPPAYHHGYIVEVPMIDTAIFLPFLYRKVLEEATLVIREITSLEELLSHHDVVVNCTGLEASKLTGDQRLYPIQGQIVKIEKEVANIRYMADDYGPNALAYIIPRHDCIILGGTAVDHAWNTVPDPEQSRAILQRCQAIHPGLKGRVIESVIGLRPGRDEVRLERDPALPIIHNYGHGGSGYTVCWGCAGEVARLVDINGKSTPRSGKEWL